MASPILPEIRRVLRRARTVQRPRGPALQCVGRDVPRKGPRQTRRATGALEADLGAGVFDHVDARAIEGGDGSRIAAHDKTAARCQCQHVRAKAVELLVRYFDEAKAKVQLVGGKLEQLMSEKLKHGWATEHGVSIAWLGGDR